MQAADVIYAYGEVRTIVDLSQKMREESEREFSSIFAETTKLGKELYGDDFEPKQPRVSGRQMNRSNIEAGTAEEYYRITHFNEFLSHVIAELKQRFLDNPPHGIGLLHLLPSQCRVETNGIKIPEVLAQAVDSYRHDLAHAVMFPT